MEQETVGTRNAGTAAGGVGDVQNIGVLDLTGIATAEELSRISSITNVGVILVSASLMPKLSSIPIKNAGATVPVPDGRNVRVLTGEITMSGESLSGAAGDDILVVVGQLVITGPVRSVGFKQLILVGQLIAPRGSEGPIGAALGHLTGEAVYYPYSQGVEVKVLNGNTNFSTTLLANQGGQESDTLMILGNTVIASPVDRIGYGQVVIVGDFFAPRESEPVLGPYVWSTGKVLYYKAKPRLFLGNERFSNDFFQLLEEPITLVLTGNFVLESDVSRDLVQQKIAEIVLTGNLKAAKQVVPLLQVLATQLTGRISAIEDEPESDDTAEASTGR